VVNTVEFISENAGTGEAEAAFSFPGETHIFLPLVMKH
jgi:hypothetical protein